MRSVQRIGAEEREDDASGDRPVDDEGAHDVDVQELERGCRAEGVGALSAYPRFRALHDGPGTFVIPNPSNAGTARILTSVAKSTR